MRRGWNWHPCQGSLTQLLLTFNFDRDSLETAHFLSLNATFYKIRATPFLDNVSLYLWACLPSLGRISSNTEFNYESDHLAYAILMPLALRKLFMLHLGSTKPLVGDHGMLGLPYVALTTLIVSGPSMLSLTKGDNISLLFRNTNLIKIQIKLRVKFAPCIQLI